MSWSTVQLSSRLLFCAQKLRPTWQLEDSSVYNIDVCPTTTEQLNHHARPHLHPDHPAPRCSPFGQQNEWQAAQQKS